LRAASLSGQGGPAIDRESSLTSEVIVGRRKIGEIRVVTRDRPQQIRNSAAV